ncbi:MAG: sulfotransferase [Dokdonella sp.]
MNTPAPHRATAFSPALTPVTLALARRAQQALERGDFSAATLPLEEALTLQPGHPELLRLCGLLEQGRGNLKTAIALFNQVRKLRPADAGVANNLGAAFALAGQDAAAIAAFRQATRLDPVLLDAWYNLGRALELSGDAAGACDAFDAALRVDPRHHPSRILRAESLKTLGRLAEAEAVLHGVLAEDAESASAWVALGNLKAFRPDGADLAAVAHAYANPQLDEAQRIDLGFAYASMLEVAGRYAEAFDLFRTANTAKRRQVRWDAPAVSALVDEILQAFPFRSVAETTAQRGREAIFLVGMPRSGSTLAEQILAAHPDVDGGGERGDVSWILQQESKRRGRGFPAWVVDATPADWKRLGEQYLQRSAAWRGSRAHFTDKTLHNWQTLGAIRRMLPGARIVHCLRDPLETCWSCYKHHFGDAQFFTYDLAELAAFQRDCTRAMQAWNERLPGWIHAHAHEALLDDPETETRALLAHCGLDFDPVCLRSHEVAREVRTASAAQVRKPLQRSVRLAERYGVLLDPLRRLLAGGRSGSEA